MILVNALPSVDTAENRDRQRELDDTDHGLQYNGDVRDQAQKTVGGNKVGMGTLVKFDYNKGRYKEDHAEQLQDVVDACTDTLLLWGGRWL